jgi:hypothetical protein
MFIMEIQVQQAKVMEIILLISLSRSVVKGLALTSID